MAKPYTISEENPIITVESLKHVADVIDTNYAKKGEAGSGSAPLVIQVKAGADYNTHTITATSDVDGSVYTGIVQDGQVIIKVGVPGGYTITNDLNGLQEHIEVGASLLGTVEFRSKKIFGIKVKQDESDPKQRVVVDTSGDLNGLRPITVNTQNGTVDYGDMENTFLFKALNHVVLKSIDKTEEIELNPNDYSKLLNGGNAPSATISNNYNVFARADKLYIYQYSTGGYEYYFISNEQIDGKYQPIGFYNDSGENDYAYLGCYGGCLDSQGRLRSVSGQRLKNRTSYTDFKTAAGKNGSDYYMDTHAHINLYEIAYLMLIQNDDSQTAVGKGRDYNAGSTTEDSEQKLMGISSGWADKKGPIAMDPATGAIKFMHIEDLWGNSLYFWEEGITFKNSKTYVRMRPPYPATTDSSGTSTYTEVTGAATSSGSISASVCDNKWGRIPSAVSGSSSTYQCDNWYPGSGDTQYACHRGSHGLWYRNSPTFSSNDSSLGARLSLIPS